jgi:thiamine-phosphate pyrophosphorylase
MIHFPLPKIYPITDVALSGLRHREQVALFAAGGATLVQLRDKTSSPRDFYEAAVDAIGAARRLGVRVIINDRLDVAIAARADGVHLGQDDLPPQAARALIGRDRIIGFSTHSPEQAAEAALWDVDYIAIGPIFDTSTKTNPDPVLGLKALRAIRQSVNKPLVAIGGITVARARSVVDSGADSVAVISDLFATGDIAARTHQYIDLFNDEGSDRLLDNTL